MRQGRTRAAGGGPGVTRAGYRGIRGSPRHVIGLVWVMHLPQAACPVLAVWVFSVIAAGTSRQPLAPAVLARLLLGVLCVQAATAGVNDYSNRYLDAAAHRTGPVVRGLVQPWEALTVPIAVTAVMLALVGSLGAVPLVLVSALLVLGLLRDLYFKGSPVSAALHALYVALFPLLAWSVFGRWQVFLPWLLPLGAVAGVGMHFARALPDLERDAATGLRGLPHRLGRRRGELLACATLPALAGLMWALSVLRVVPAHGPALALATGAAFVATALMAALYISRRSGTGLLRVGFIVQVLGAICLGAGWLAAVAF